MAEAELIAGRWGSDWVALLGWPAPEIALVLIQIKSFRSPNW
jgi:hypothetical protein